MLKKIACACSFVLVVFFTLGTFCACKNNTDTEVVINVNIDVLKIGKADCIVINTGTKILMIDTGEEENLPTVHSFMQNKGYEKIDILIITHFDKDHLGGALEIIPKYQVSTVIESTFTSSTALYANYRNVLNEQGITPMKLTEDYTLEIDGCKIEIDVPKSKKYSEKHDNNSSLVVSMTCNEKKLLFCGDAMELRLEELIDKPIGVYDFIKLPYHGNYLQNYREFLDATSPSYAAITCSGKNPASGETLALLQEYNVEAFQTRYGTVHIFTDGTELTVNQ